MPPQLLGVREDGPIRVLTLERPEVHNAMSEQLMDELALALSDAERAGTAVVVITGSGRKSFCSGGDLKEFDALRTSEPAIAMSLRMQRLSRAMRRSSVVTVAALNGDAYGGGLEFALACDLRVAAEHARFGFLQITLGITPAWRGVSRLRDLVGRSTALKLLLTGERFDATEAQRYGIVDVVTDADVLDVSAELARRIASYPRNAVRTIKAMIDAPQGDDDDSLALEAQRFCNAWLSDEHWAALASSRRLRADGSR